MINGRYYFYAVLTALGGYAAIKALSGDELLLIIGITAGLITGLIPSIIVAIRYRRRAGARPLPPLANYRRF